MNLDDKKLRFVESMAKILSNTYKINIVFSRSGECLTTKDKMVLPYASVLDEDILLAQMGHETAHLIFTNFDAIPRLAEFPHVHNRDFFYCICNVLEDARIETLFEEEYPGYKRRFRKLAEEYIRELKKDLIKDNKDLYLSMILDVLFYKLRGFKCDWYPTDVIAFVDSNLLTIGQRCFECKDTLELEPIALEIYRIIGFDEEESFEPKKNKKNKSCGEPLSGDKEEEKDTQSTGGSDVEAPKFGNSGELQATKGFTVKISEEVVSAARKEMYNADLFDLMKESPLKTSKDLVKEELSKTVQKAYKDNVDYLVYPIVLQKPEETEKEVELGDIGIYNKILNSVNKDIAYIKQQLKIVAEDKKLTRWRTTSSYGRRINRKALSKIFVGDTSQLYLKRYKEDKLDVAFTLLIDESGSMGVGTKALEAQRAAVMFAEVLYTMSVPFEIVGFTTCGLTEEQRYKALKEDTGSTVFNRADNLHHNMYKRFGEDYGLVKTRITRLVPAGGNFEQDTLADFIWPRLNQYCTDNNVSRSMILYVGDFIPEGGPRGEEKLASIIREIETCPSSDFIGFSIQSKEGLRYCKKCILIDKMENLGPSIVKTIQSAFVE